MRARSSACQANSYNMVQKAEKRPRGRPRAYDPHDALLRATVAFWNFGYAGTSMDVLSDAMGMNRPSVYGAFGDKRALYLQALAEYRRSSCQAMREALSLELPFADALRQLYARAIDIYLSGELGARGCLLIGTAATEAVHDDAIRASYAAGLRELDDEMERRMRHAVKQGDLETDLPLPVLARLACGIMNTLAVRARGGDSRAALESIATAGARLVSRG